MSIKKIANAFWPAVADQEITDMLFSQVDTFPNPKTHSAPNFELANACFKGSMAHVIAIASNPLTQPSLLAKFASDSRVSVRIALLANPSLPHETRLFLTRWARDRGEDSFASSIDRLSLADVVMLLQEEVDAQQPHKCYWNSNSLAKRCIEEPSQIIPLAKVCSDGCLRELAKLITEGLLKGTTITQLVQARPDSLHSILNAIISDGSTLTLEIATLWKQWVGEPHQRLTLFSQSDRFKKRFKSCEPGALELLATGDLEQLCVAIVNGLDDGKLYEYFSKNLIIQDTITALKFNNASPQTESIIVQKYIENAGVANAQRVSLAVLLTALRHEISSDVLFELLMLGDTDTWTWWLQGSSVNEARAGILSRLITSASPSQMHFTLEDLNSVVSRSSAAGRFRNNLVEATLKKSEFAPELVELCDRWLGNNLSHTVVAQSVYPLVAAAFNGPDKLQKWHMFLVLGCEWKESFTNLLASVLALSE
jgi:hypothetical protein